MGLTSLHYTIFPLNLAANLGPTHSLCRADFVKGKGPKVRPVSRGRKTVSFAGSRHARGNFDTRDTCRLRHPSTSFATRYDRRPMSDDSARDGASKLAAADGL
ncbi:hypothetical protein KM043_004422 [Ampulex compressa]|nr:hypothetical protein KM043_004422 [Ampulex compressa]